MVLFIDEVKELGYFKVLDRIVVDGRKYGLGLWVVFQFFCYIFKDVLINMFIKLILLVDFFELFLIVCIFRFFEEAIVNLNFLELLVCFGKNVNKVNIVFFY